VGDHIEAGWRPVDVALAADLQRRLRETAKRARSEDVELRVLLRFRRRDDADQTRQTERQPKNADEPLHRILPKSEAPLRSLALSARQGSPIIVPGGAAGQEDRRLIPRPELDCSSNSGSFSWRPSQSKLAGQRI